MVNTRINGRNPARIRALLIATAATALAITAAPSAVTATPITYDLVGASATFFANGTDTLTGNFTFDPSTDTLNSVDITVAGPVCCTGEYTTPHSASNDAIEMTRVDGSLTDFLTLTFLNPLSSASDLLSKYHAIEGTAEINSSSVAGTAVPAPEPSSFALLAGAVGLFLLSCRKGWRRRETRPIPTLGS